MVSKTKAALKYWKVKRKNRKSKKIIRKNQKVEDRFDAQWRFDWVLKEIPKIAKAVKVKIKVEGYKNLPRGNFILAPNHQSLVDVPAIIWAMKKQTHERDINNRRVVFLAKKDVAENKKFNNLAKVIDSFLIDRKDPRQAIKVINKLSQYLKENPNVGAVIFPEGTRTKTGELGEFKGGGFQVAKKNFIPIVPCTINNTALTTTFQREEIEIEVIFHKAIKPLKFIRVQTPDIGLMIKNIIKTRYKKFVPLKNKNEKIA